VGEARTAGLRALRAAVADLEAGAGWREDVGELAQELLDHASDGLVDDLLRARIRLLISIGTVRGGHPEEAAAVLREVRDWAAAHGHRGLQGRAELRLSLLFRMVGDVARALEHSFIAVELALPVDDPPLRCEAVLGLADSLDECGSAEEASTRYAEAHALSTDLPDPRLRWLVLNNWAYAASVGGRLEEAASLAEQLEDAVAQAGHVLPLFAADTVAGVLAALGRPQEAATKLLSVVELTRSTRPMLDGQVLVTLASLERGLGELARAEEHLSEAERLSEAFGMTGVAVLAMEERAELLAAQGDPAAAYALHKVFHEEALALHSLKRETQARTLQALFAVDEARRESARYRELSYRDALTGLLNRRHVDEDLDRRLAAGVRGLEGERELSVALLDLDHFKRVNDTRSHEVGDRVLQRLAELLQGEVAGPAGAGQPYAARLGGEEFLLVLPGVGPAEAVAVAERLRRRVAGADWAAVTGGLLVTASIGVASAPVDARDRASLLRTADQRLYRAKQSGRDRVEPAPRPTPSGAGSSVSPGTAGRSADR
jgi:diguanylate cyclase (GGDEF)-like protein